MHEHQGQSGTDSIPYKSESLLLEGNAGVIEALIAYPDDYQTGQPIAILCHPHPLYGGSMDNKVVYMLSKTFLELGVATLRFNFRGVGKSEGHFDHGEGESEDLFALVSQLRQRHPQAPLWLAGFSFGAYVAYRSVAQAQPERLLLVAPPVSMYDFSPFAPPRLPWMVIQGGRDEVIDPEAVSQWVEQQPVTPIYHWLPEADHFFHGRLVQLKSEILQHWRD